MHSRFFALLLIAGVAGQDAIAQSTNEASGWLGGVRSAWVTRWSTSTAGKIGSRFAHARIRGVGPMTAVAAVNYDFVATTTDNFVLHIVNESSTIPNVPDNNLTNALFSSSSMPILSGTQIISLTTPINPPAATGFYLMVEHQGTYNATTGDGGWTYFTRGDLPATPNNTEDIPGNRMPATAVPAVDSVYGGWDGTAAAAAGTLPRQIWADPLHSNLTHIAGSCIAKTNQARQPGIGGVISGFMSGMHPDTTDAKLSTPPRADDIGYQVGGELGKGAVFVFVLAGNFGPTLQLSSINASWKGVSCLDLASMIVLTGVVADANGGAQFLVPNSIAKNFKGLNLYWSALGIKGTVLIGAPCGQQRLNN
jgi:hypothetical protein